MTVKRMMMIAMAIAIIFVQEQLLLILPNIQFTVLLIILFVSVFSFKESVIMIIGYVFLDNIYFGGLNFFILTPMLMAWLLIPVLYHTVLNKTKNEIILAIFALVFGVVYGMMFVPFRMLQIGVYNIAPYIISDLPFQLIMSLTGLITVLLLYKPLLQSLTTIIDAPPLSHNKA